MKLRRYIVSYWQIYLMMLPGMLHILVFNYGAMYGIAIAFKDFWMTKGILGSPWVGFSHFERMFETAKFWLVFKNTLIISMQKLVTGFPMPIAVALLLNELRSEKYKRTIQTLLYLPHFISWVVISGIIFALFDAAGPVNTMIAHLGMDKVNFLTDAGTFRPMLVVSSIWKETGWGTIIYLAALSSISPELYEAAYIDGAGRWQQMRYITFPSILPTISVLLILRFGGIMSVSFDQVFNLYNEAVYRTGDIIQTYNYRIGLAEGDYSMGAAVGLFLNVINCAMLIVVNKVSKRLSGNGLY